MTNSILIDTNLLLRARSYHLAKTQSNKRYLELLNKKEFKGFKEIYNVIDARFEIGAPVYVSEISTVEMKVVHVRNSLHEFARNVYNIPAESLHDHKGRILNELRLEFNEVELFDAIQDFENLLEDWGLMKKIRIIPAILSKEERITWRERHETIFQLVVNYAGFETQDAYIFATALAMGVDELWSADKPFRLAIEQLRKINFVNLLKDWDGFLFPEDLFMPQVRDGNNIPAEYKIETT